LAPQGEGAGGIGRSEIWIAIAIAIVSLSTAVAAWRTSDLDSHAGDAEREGLIQTVQSQSLTNEDWRLVYEQAANAQRYFASQAEAGALAASGNAGARDQAQALQDYLLPNLALIAGQLVTNPAYLQDDGSLDLQARFADEQAANQALNALDLEGAFARADRLRNQRRWLSVGAVLLVVSLFWLALAEISRERARRSALLIGLAFYGFGLVWFAVVELGALAAARGGV
jgi:hypothetical protein